MKVSPKVILSAVGIAALLTSSAMARQERRQNAAAPQTVRVPSDARGSVAPPVNEGGPYSPSLPTSRYGESRDFQGGSSR